MYGWQGLVVIGVVAILYFLINRSINKSNDKLADTISSQNQVLVQSMVNHQQDLVSIIGKTLERNENQKNEVHMASIQHRIDISKPMQDKVYDTMIYFRAKRCGILEFHNSKENLNGLSFLWYDMHYETNQKNVLPINQKCKDMQISNLVTIIDSIRANKGVVIYKRKDLENLQSKSSVLYEQLVHELNSDTIIYAGLYGNNNSLIGLMLLEYDDNEYKFNDNLYDKAEIKERATSISSLLEFNKPM